MVSLPLRHQQVNHAHCFCSINITISVFLGLDSSFTLLPEELSSAGYVSHIVGKWHLGICNHHYWPESRGFQSHFGFLLGGEGYFDHARDGGFDWRDGDRVAWETNQTYSTTLIQERATQIISDHDPSNPLFLYVPFQAVHGPLEVNKHTTSYNTITCFKGS